MNLCSKLIWPCGEHCCGVQQNRNSTKTWKDSDRLKKKQLHKPEFTFNPVLKPNLSLHVVITWTFTESSKLWSKWQHRYSQSGPECFPYIKWSSAPQLWSAPTCIQSDNRTDDIKEASWTWGHQECDKTKEIEGEPPYPPCSLWLICCLGLRPPLLPWWFPPLPPPLPSSRFSLHQLASCDWFWPLPLPRPRLCPLGSNDNFKYFPNDSNLTEYLSSHLKLIIAAQPSLWLRKP